MGNLHVYVFYRLLTHFRLARYLHVLSVERMHVQSVAWRSVQCTQVLDVGGIWTTEQNTIYYYRRTIIRIYRTDRIYLHSRIIHSISWERGNKISQAHSRVASKIIHFWPLSIVHIILVDGTYILGWWKWVLHFQAEVCHLIIDLTRFLYTRFSVD